jgi:hypothetical protein
MDAVPEIIGNLVMFVALCHTVVSADILCIETPDYQPFVFPDRQQGLALLDPGTSGNQTDRN